jgi:pimeloyl-ACP methyl ester carboxylesterase
METTNTSDVILLGHSTGAQAVLHTAQLVPDRICAAVITSPTFAPAARGLFALLRRVTAERSARS